MESKLTGTPLRQPTFTEPPAVSFAELEQIMVRARRQRAEETARLIRLAAKKVARWAERAWLGIARRRQLLRGLG